MAGQPQSLDLLLNAGSLEGVIFEQQDLALGEPGTPPLLPCLQPLEPGIAEAIDPRPGSQQMRQIVGPLMRGRIKQGDGPGGKQPFPLPAGIGSGAVQIGIGRQARPLDRLMGDSVQGIDADRVNVGSWLSSDSSKAINSSSVMIMSCSLAQLSADLFHALPQGGCKGMSGGLLPTVDHLYQGGSPHHFGGPLHLV